MLFKIYKEKRSLDELINIMNKIMTDPKKLYKSTKKITNTN